MITDDQRRKLAELLAKEHVAVVITQGGEWATGTMQAFAETEALDILFIMDGKAEKFQNALKRPQVTVVVDTRDTGNAETFQIARASIQGEAAEVKAFLQKNPFEAPFFSNPALRMVRVRPKRVSYANGLHDSFKAEF
jgi:general stress protein 26